MVTKEPAIPEDSVLSQHLPADYADAFSKEITGKAELTPDELLKATFSRSPKWVNGLMKLRDMQVKPFGLETGDFEGQIQKRITHRSDREIAFGMDDKHLSFEVSLLCHPKNGETQRVTVTTMVKYNRTLGKVYFFFVRPFHRIIVSSSLNRL